MSNGILKQTGKSTKDLAKQIAKQVAREPLEVGKVAKDSIIGSEKPVSQEILPGQVASEKPLGQQEKAIIESKRKRLLQALEAELADIRKQKKIQDEESKRQVELEVQRQEEIKKSQISEIEVSSKPGRKMAAGIKSHLQRLKKSTETRLPPTG